MKVVIPILAVVLGLIFAWAIVFQDGTPQTPSPPATPPQTDPLADPNHDAHPSVTTARPATPSASASASKPTTTPEPPQVVSDSSFQVIDGLHPVPAFEAMASTIGSIQRDGQHMLEVQLTGWGAAVRYIRLSRYTQATLDDTPFEVQTPVEVTATDGRVIRLYPFAAKTVTVNTTPIQLENQRWHLVEPGMYQMVIADGQNQPVLRLTRHYQLQRGPTSYDLRCDQTIENLSDLQAMRVVWEQYAQGDIPNDDAVYLGDRRMLVAGYHNLEYDPLQQFVHTDGAFLARKQILDGGSLWHHNDKLPDNRRLVWVASLNRYFAMAVHPVVQAGQPKGTPVPNLDQVFVKLGTQVIRGAGDQRGMAFTLTSKPIDIQPASQARLDLALYAGPRKREIFEQEPYKRLKFSKLVVYELGCAMFTFQPLARGLLTFLKWIHAAVFDWGVAIIFLVLCVRLLLHPITKKAQVNMFKMSKQMQSLQPDIEKLKKKYKNDQQKFQQEQLKLWREKGINPVNMLGCLPMFLQTPIWVALYAMLYLAIELRHQPAFYGVFQWISNGRWHFLADLSSPDNFIQFAGKGYTLNLYFIHPTFAAINLLPLLMAVVFYFQQKLTTPPPANEQAAQQQKMMKFMVLLFPVMLYSAPSGLTLYILASTCAGIIDSYLVRKHVREQEEAGTLFDKKPAKPGGFMDRMHKTLESKQRQLAQRQKQQAGHTPKHRKR